jgi:Right handed beta helix region
MKILVTLLVPAFFYSCKTKRSNKSPEESPAPQASTSPVDLANTGAAQATAAQTKEYYVSTAGSDGNDGSEAKPWKTIQKGIDSIRSSNKTGLKKFVLNIKGGTYRIDKPLSFTAADNPPSGGEFIIRNFKNEKVFISGGTEVSNWTTHDAGKKMFKANVGELKFRQIYVEGKKYIRARTPNLEKDSDKSPYLKMPGLAKDKKVILVSSNNISKWNNFEKVEMIYNRDWITNVLRLKDFTVTDGVAEVVLQEPERFQFFDRDTPKMRDSDPFFFENAHGFLDAKKEWFLDTSSKTLFVITESGVAPTKVEVPVIETLVSIAGGSATEQVQGISFEGLVFEHSTWLVPDKQGLTGGQSIFSNLVNHPSGAIYISHAKNIRIEGCAIRNLGNHGVLVKDTSSGIRIKGNIIENGSANGVVFYGGGSNGDIVEDNSIQNLGLDFGAGTGVVIHYGANTQVLHNNIWGIPYAGVSVGWGWTEENTTLTGNIIKRNEIHNICQRMSDCGGIYTLSRQEKTVLEENWIHGIKRSEYANGAPSTGIFHDEASGEITDAGNLIEDYDSEKTRRNKAGTIYETKSSLTADQIRKNAGPRKENTSILQRMNYHK